MDLLHALSNFGITLGYFLFAVIIAPYVGTTRKWARWAGSVFFFTCGVTHLDMGIAAIRGHVHELTHLYLVVNHAVQVIAVWIFFIGVWLEFGPRRQDDRGGHSAEPG